MSSATPLLPDIYDPHKHRETKSVPERLKEKPVHPAAEKTQTPAEFARPPRQSVCVDLLREGFPRSFAQTFALLRRGDAADARKLRALQQRLTSAEAAERHGRYGEAYDSHMFLAGFFTEPEDKWLKHHFVELALHSARKFKMDSGKREAEANLHMGQVYLEQGQLERAREHYEVFYQSTAGRTWQDPGGRVHHSRSCEELQKVFTLLGQRPRGERDGTHTVKMFNKAYQMAKESGDRGLEGEAAYRLGLVYQSIGDQKTAKQFFSICMEISTTLGNTDSLGRAYEAIAKSLQSEGKLTEATEYLEKFAEVSQSKQDRNLEKAYMCLGNILSSRKQYDGAREHFGRAYEIACNLASVARLRKAQVCTGSARALGVMQTYHRLIETPARQNIQEIFSWKQRRRQSSSVPSRVSRHLNDPEEISAAAEVSEILR
ncbi:tetratricopeptide repeat protein 29 [Puntigrus tetrazona]|uniref:tetratricopeptide repeat protein 29 n=1 Tax=Puntigrus tetrazona TaxID=1606681 RepID=UPI001C8A3E89|nr:tetratricopeptide repeat protein 29 [Puntigrus tetrazona]